MVSRQSYLRERIMSKNKVEMTSEQIINLYKKISLIKDFVFENLRLVMLEDIKKKETKKKGFIKCIDVPRFNTTEEVEQYIESNKGYTGLQPEAYREYKWLVRDLNESYSALYNLYTSASFYTSNKFIVDNHYVSNLAWIINYYEKHIEDKNV